MSTAVYFFSFFSAFLVAIISTPFITRYAHNKKWIDVPGNARSMHKKATPRAGGLAVILAFFIGLGIEFFFGDNVPGLLNSDSLIFHLAFPLGCVTIMLVGLYDDAFGLGFKKKFLFQGLIAYTMFLAGFRITIPEALLNTDDAQLQTALGLPITILWYVLVMNAVNLIDGLDGLASGITMISVTSLAIALGLSGNMAIASVAIVLAGALLGFLFYNFNPASIFLGDTGSLFLGFVLATCGIQGSAHVNPILAAAIPALAIGFPLLDTVVAFLRRILNGGSPFAPDKDHIHHRLTGKFNLSVKGAVFRLYLLNGLLGFAAVCLVALETVQGFLVLGATVLLVMAWLRYLGYFEIRETVRMFALRMKTPSSRRVPRGEWDADQEDPVREPVADDSSIRSTRMATSNPRRGTAGWSMVQAAE